MVLGVAGAELGGEVFGADASFWRVLAWVASLSWGPVFWLDARRAERLGTPDTRGASATTAASGTEAHGGGSTQEP